MAEQIIVAIPRAMNKRQVDTAHYLMARAKDDKALLDFLRGFDRAEREYRDKRNLASDNMRTKLSMLQSNGMRTDADDKLVEKQHQAKQAAVLAEFKAEVKQLGKTNLYKRLWDFGPFMPFSIISATSFVAMFTSAMGEASQVALDITTKVFLPSLIPTLVSLPFVNKIAFKRLWSRRDKIKDVAQVYKEVPDKVNLGIDDSRAGPMI
jgi:hypothetical protein